MFNIVVPLYDDECNSPPMTFKTEEEAQAFIDNNDLAWAIVVKAVEKSE